MVSSTGALWTVHRLWGDPRRSLPQDRKAEIEDEEAVAFKWAAMHQIPLLLLKQHGEITFSLSPMPT